MGKVLGQNIANISIERKSGLVELHIKYSTELENVFKQLSASSGLYSFRIGDILHKSYALDQGPLDSIPELNGYMTDYANCRLDTNGVFNSLFLFARGNGSAEGNTFKLSGLYSESFLKLYVESAQKLIHALFKQYISDLSIDCNIMIKTVGI